MNTAITILLAIIAITNIVNIHLNLKNIKLTRQKNSVNINVRSEITESDVKHWIKNGMVTVLENTEDDLPNACDCKIQEEGFVSPKPTA